MRCLLRDLTKALGSGGPAAAAVASIDKAPAVLNQAAAAPLERRR